MIDFIQQHYKLLTGIIVPIIVAVLGILKVRSQIKKNNTIKGNNNVQLTSEKDISNTQSFNTVNQSSANLQIAGNNNQISSFDMNSIQMLAQSFNKTMYPFAEKGFEKLRLNSQQFLANLNSQLEQLSPSELEKFSEADVQMALYKAIQGAGRTDSNQVHEILGRLIADRVQKPKRVITELAINESIEITSKLDVNLIKILAFSFIFSRTKYTHLLNEEVLFQRLLLVATEFNDLDVTSSKFEYLEAISCGKLTQFISNNLIDSISINYPQLFIKKISSLELEELSLPANIQNACFTQIDNSSFQLNPYMGLHLFESVPINVGNIPFTITDNSIKEQLLDFLSKHRLSQEEIKTHLLKNNSFESILNIWDKNHFSQFDLTAVGIAIGRAFLQQKNIGNYDINIWIN